MSQREVFVSGTSLQSQSPPSSPLSIHSAPVAGSPVFLHGEQSMNKLASVPLGVQLHAELSGKLRRRGKREVCVHACVCMCVSACVCVRVCACVCV